MSNNSFPFFWSNLSCIRHINLVVHCIVKNMYDIVRKNSIGKGILMRKIEIKKLSKRYDVRKLNSDDIQMIFSPLFFSQLFVRPPQTTILLFCISFPGGWSWSLSPVQCHEPPSIHHQALFIRFLKFIFHFHCIIIRDLI